MMLTWQTVLTAGSVLAALTAILGYILKAHSWVLAQEEQSRQLAALETRHEEDIRHLKRENTLVCFALSACLDGLVQLGANHTVSTAKDKLDKYLNQQAHE